LDVYTDETVELTKEGDISFFQKELEARIFPEFNLKVVCVLIFHTSVSVFKCKLSKIFVNIES